MFEPIPDLPDGVIGFEAVGDVEASDYTEILAPAVERASGTGGIRLVLVVGQRFTGYSPAAMKEDASFLGRGVEWKRIALVSDLGWVVHLATVVGWMVPGEFRRFALAERAAAIDWAAAGG